MSTDPADCITQDESVTMAILVMLEAMTPPQRAAFVLHDVYGIPFQEIGEVLGRSAAACRTLASAARQRMRSTDTNTVDATMRSEVVNRFKAAFVSGDIHKLLPLLESHVTVIADGGGYVTAARRPIQGIEKVGRYLVGISRLFAALTIEEAEINGTQGLVFRNDGETVCVMSFDVVGQSIRYLWLTLNPRKLTHWGR